MALISLAVVVLLLHSVMGYFYLYEFLDTSRESYSIGDDVTLTCPVSLCEGEDYKRVEWVFWYCGRYFFKNSCYDKRGWWDKATYSGHTDIPISGSDMTMQVPANWSVKPTLTIKNLQCSNSAYYHCRVIGTKGTDREHRFDVYPFRNASAEPKLSPDPIIIPENQDGSIHVTCTDDAHTPGSSIRMYYGHYEFWASFFEVATQCTITYSPGACHEVAICTASFEMSTLRNQYNHQNSVHCDITRPGGKRVTVKKYVQVV